jgi:hypothetical protein
MSGLFFMGFDFYRKINFDDFLKLIWKAINRSYDN